MALNTPGSVVFASASTGKTKGQEVDLNRARVIEESDDVGIRRRGLGRGLSVSFSKLPESEAVENDVGGA